LGSPLVHGVVRLDHREQLTERDLVLVRDGFALECLRHALPQHAQRLLLVVCPGTLPDLAAVHVDGRVPEAAPRIAIDTTVASHGVSSFRLRVLVRAIAFSLPASLARSDSSISSRSVIPCFAA